MRSWSPPPGAWRRLLAGPARSRQSSASSHRQVPAREATRPEPAGEARQAWGGFYAPCFRPAAPRYGKTSLLRRVLDQAQIEGQWQPMPDTPCTRQQDKRSLLPSAPLGARIVTR